jgi:predicted dehydrogenase
VGVVGMGIGQMHIANYLTTPNCRLAALCDADAGRVAEVARERGVEPTFTDADEMFRSGEIDAVSICTPNAYHAPMSIAALEAGLHVLCEKPMAMSTAEAQRMIDAADKAGKVLSIHFNHRMSPYVHAMKNYVESGDLGDIYFARTIWHRRRGIPARPGFVSKEKAGGGAMIDLGVHQLDQALFVMGHPKVKSLTAQVYTKFAEADVPHMEMDVDDFSVAFIRFENGATLEMEISWASHHDTDENRLLQLYGTEGGARRYLVDYAGGPQDLSIYRRRHGALTEEHVTSPPESTNVQADFIESIRTGKAPLCTAEHGLVTMKILDALYESSRTGREVAFNEMFAAGRAPAEKHPSTPS